MSNIKNRRLEGGALAVIVAALTALVPLGARAEPETTTPATTPATPATPATTTTTTTTTTATPEREGADPSIAPAADDAPPPPELEAGPTAGEEKAPTDAAHTPPKLAPLDLPPDTEQADSGDNIGFVNVRFGVVGQALQDFVYDNTGSSGEYVGKTSTQLKTLQLRAFGQLPLLEDSFFLINVRTELSPRISFAMFQVPIGGGHYINVNSGGGSLSNALIISTAKQPLLEPAFWMTTAFEQGNGAAVELHGPIVARTLRYRLFVGGGAGVATGNVGGQRITFNNDTFTYETGAQLQASPIGIYDRFDSPFLWRTVPLALGVNVGVKYESRAQERFPAANVSATFRYGRFELIAENYTKAELNFGQVQDAYDVTAGILLVPEWLFFAVDAGQFWTTDFGAVQDYSQGFIKVGPPPKQLETDLRKERNETDLRAALHFYFWRNNGVMSLRYTLKMQDPPFTGRGSDRTDQLTTHDVWLAATMRF